MVGNNMHIFSILFRKMFSCEDESDSLWVCAMVREPVLICERYDYALIGVSTDFLNMQSVSHCSVTGEVEVRYSLYSQIRQKVIRNRVSIEC